MCHNLITQLIPNPNEDMVYIPQLVMIIARVMSDIDNKTMAKGVSFGQQYILQKGLKKFGDRRSKSSAKEMDKLHQQNNFTPFGVTDLTSQEKRKAVEALIFLNKKRDKFIKGRMVYNMKLTR